MRFSLLAFVGFIVGAPVAAAEEQPALPGWMAGCWESHQGDEWAEECWMPPRAGMMMGSGRRGTGEKVGEWEFMRIALNEPNADGPVVRMGFSAAPGGSGWTLFAWSPNEAKGVTFYNRAHDYPQIVTYWRDGARLKGRISMADGSRPVEWDYAPMRGE